jgi:uncharacterized membrane-anchored protein
MVQGIRYLAIAAIVTVSTLCIASPSLSETDGSAANEAIAKAEALPWAKYPANADLAGKATLPLSQELEYVGPPNSTQFIQLNGNPPPSVETFIVARRDFRWFSAFSFDPSGYVRDDEKVDPDKLLADLQAANQKALSRRKDLGLSALNLVGWYVPPHYDKETHRLEWGTKLVDEANNVTVNYTVRLLGRTGVMSATLVSDPKNLDQDVQEFKASLNSVKFNSGENYSEFRNGDKIAAYGLGALVLGGAAAVAAKSGAVFFKVIWVGILAVGAAVMASIRKLFGGRAKSS